MDAGAPGQCARGRPGRDAGHRIPPAARRRGENGCEESPARANHLADPAGTGGRPAATGLAKGSDPMQGADTMDNTIDAAGDFGELLERHRGIVRKVAGTYAHDAHDRADLAQEIAAQLWRAWPGYDPARSFSTWMYRIALNVAIGHARGDGRRRQLSVPLDEQAHDMADANATDHETEQHIRLLQAFIARQSPLDRALLLLYLDARPQREIAEVLGIGESNVSTKIGRLKQRIRDEL